jgi:membrane fusion protein
LSIHIEHPLFRPEVAEARRGRLQGEIILRQSAGAQWLAVLLFAIIALMAVWIIFGQYNRTERALGILVTDSASAKVVAIRAGIITALSAREGQRVVRGQKLAVIHLEQGGEGSRSAIQESLAAIEAQRTFARQQVALARARAASERARLSASLSGLRQQRVDLTGQITLQEEMVKSAQDQLDRVQSVEKRGFVSRVEVERRRQATLVARQQLGQLRQQFNELSAQESQTRAEISRITVDTNSTIVDVQSNAEALLQQRAQIGSERAYTVSAPISGIVTALQAAPGRSVNSNVPLMVIIPDGTKLHADIYAPTRAIGFVKPGQEVRLLYDAFPYQRFGSFTGRITRVSRIVIDPQELSVPIKIEEAVYRIEVAPEAQSVSAFGEALPLQPGMTLTANIVLDRQSFGDWLLQPLNAVLKRNR